MTEVFGQLCDLLDGWVSEGELHLATRMSAHPQADTALRAYATGVAECGVEGADEPTDRG
jgi:hypothetical protein